MEMPTRRLGRTDMSPSVISLGAWAIGGAWGPVDDEQSMRTLHAAMDAGVNFIDTADVYGDGRSERLHFERWLPREQWFPEEDTEFSATLKAARRAYELAGHARHAEAVVYYLV